MILKILESILKIFLRNKFIFGNTLRKAEYKSYKGNYILANSFFCENSDQKKTIYILKYPEELSKKIYIYNKFDDILFDKSLELLKKKKTKFLINIGSHVGTSFIAPIKKGLVDYCLAFEPSPENYTLLQANVLMNKINDKVQLFNLALSDKKRQSYLFLNDKTNSADYVLDEAFTRNRNINFKVNTDIIDNFWKNKFRKNCIIFLDVQGSEFKILSKARKFIKYKIPIIMEFQPDCYQNFDQKKNFRLISQYNFFVDLRLEKKQEMNFKNFCNLFKDYKKKSSDILIF